MAEEADVVGVYDHRQAVVEKEAAEMLEVIPSGVGGDEDRAQAFAGIVVHGEQQGLLVLGGPPLMDKRNRAAKARPGGSVPSVAGLWGVVRVGRGDLKSGLWHKRPRTPAVV